MSAADERVTQWSTVRQCAQLAGVERFDLDVAAHDRYHRAKAWYTKREDGLRQPWHGRVWANPPWSDIGPWVARAWAWADRCNIICMLLPGNRTEQPWWQRYVEPYRDGKGTPVDLDNMGCPMTSHFLPGRVRYGTPHAPVNRSKASPPFTSVLLVWRP